MAAVSTAPTGSVSSSRDSAVDAPPVLVHTSSGPRELPKFIPLEPRVPPRPQLDGRIRRAEERFEAGKRLYLQGEFAAARTEFDTAIELLLASPEAAPDRALMEKKLEQMVDRIHRYDIDGLGAGSEETGVAYDKNPLQDILELTFPIDPSLKNKVREQLLATASQLPLEMNDEVIRYINFFTSERGKRTIVAGLKRSGRYRDMILRILSEEGVPQELIHLAQAESGFLPRALSWASAAGMWQFVAYRGREYGLNQSPYLDERLDPEKATRAGARHLRDLYHQFGDWYLAMAAYNCGPGCVARAVERTGYADFWELRRRNAIPRETTNYVPIIVAMTIMVKNAKDYGIEDVQFDDAIVYDTVPMTAATSLTLAADLLDMPVAELRELNPSLLKDIAPAGYGLRVPRGNSPVLTAALQNVPAERRTTMRTHRVQAGETAATIAKRYRTGTASLLALNKASVEDLAEGDLVVVPAAPVVKAAAARKAPARRAASSWKKSAAPSARNARPTAPRRTAGAPVAARTRR
ncbi:MAG: transglycosylase SLT domain-containing protein [Bryobacterales bacterium]|nr:transglycosylase SLT domain-containing protein [Bryobacterales bacterium]